MRGKGNEVVGCGGSYAEISRRDWGTELYDEGSEDGDGNRGKVGRRKECKNAL